jgi:hypothetical protein
MAFSFGKRRRSRSRRSSDDGVKVSRRRRRRSSSRRSKRRSGRGGSTGAKKLFKERVMKVNVLRKKGMGQKAAWKKVMAESGGRKRRGSKKAFGVQIIPGF